MSPISTSTVAKRLRYLLGLPRHYFYAIFPSGVPRWFWHLFQWLALALAAVGAYYAWRKFPQEVQIDPAFFSLAIGVYVLTFGMHLLAWHSLSRIFLGQPTLHMNIEAVAGSNLVKYLPTIAWYIANRSHFYHTRGIAQKSVVIASFSELILMIGSGAILLVSHWIARMVSPLASVIFFLVCVAILLWALARHAGGDAGTRRWWGVALFLYGGSWLMGILMLWLIMRALTPISIADSSSIADIWLLTGLTNYAISVTMGFFGIAREVTLTVLLAQLWPWSVSIAAAIIVKLILTLGEIGCSLAILGLFQLQGRWTGNRDGKETP